MPGRKLSYFNTIATSQVTNQHKIPIFIDGVLNESLGLEEFMGYVWGEIRILGINDFPHDYQLWDRTQSATIDWDTGELITMEGINLFTTINWKNSQLTSHTGNILTWGDEHIVTGEPFIGLENGTSLHLSPNSFVDIQSIPTMDNPFLCIPIYNSDTGKRYFIQLREEL